MKKIRLAYKSHKLEFRFDARTSRGAIASHRAFYLFAHWQDSIEVMGVGECAPLAGLSIDDRGDLEQKLEELCRQVNSGACAVADKTEHLLAQELGLQEWPAIRFALETALLDLENGGKRTVFHNKFSRGAQGIPINGLIWMGDKVFMQEQIAKKLAEGYTCLKLKIGSLDFTSELELLQQIREVAGAAQLTIRVDANGAFSPQEAFKKLERLAKYDVHSIEQPIRQGQLQEMEALCAYTPIPIALDEELIGVQEKEAQEALLAKIKPQYIILKPTLVGGLRASAAWIQLAEERGIGWWITSALESNIGLNAISQFTANYGITTPHGLGTGQLYHNNIDSPLQIEQGRLWYRQGKAWDEQLLFK